jgi:hypothetical protein
VATGYASALVEACSDKKALESVHGDMETIVGYMAANPSVGTFLKNPTMESKTVKDVLDKLGKEADFHPFTKNFLNLLVDKKRIGAIEAIAEEFENLYCESTDTQVSNVEEPPLTLESSTICVLFGYFFLAERRYTLAGAVRRCSGSSWGGQIALDAAGDIARRGKSVQS